MSNILTIKERFEFLWMDIKLFIYKVKTAYWQVKNIRMERRIKELEAILQIQQMEKNN